MEQYRTEEEQLEALRRWWNENGRSTVAAIIIALAAGFGWQGWKGYQQGQNEAASNSYQALLAAISQGEDSQGLRPSAAELAEGIKAEHGGSTYAQFAALHLARFAVDDGDLAEAQAQLRWVLGKASKGSDTAQVAQLRLARVLAAQGDTDQALAILAEGADGPYQASYALARADILLGLGRNDEARQAYSQAMMLAGQGQGQVDMRIVQQKLQSLSPLPARELDAAAPASALDAQVEASVRDETGKAAAIEGE